MSCAMLGVIKHATVTKVGSGIINDFSECFTFIAFHFSYLFLSIVI